jgi:hypothetical protein
LSGTDTLGGGRVAHPGDLGQRDLRDEQAQALGCRRATDDDFFVSVW